MNTKIFGIIALGLLPIVIGIGFVYIPILAIHTSLSKTMLLTSLSLFILLFLLFAGSIVYLSKLLGKFFIYLSFAISFFYILAILMYYELILIINFERDILKALIYYILLAFSIFGMGISLWLYFRRLYKSKNVYQFKVASVSFLIFGIVLFIPLIITFTITILLYIMGGGHGTGIAIPFGFVFSLQFSMLFLAISLLVGVFFSITGFFKLKD